MKWSGKYGLAVITLGVAVLGTVAAWLVVPEFRRWVGFDRPDAQSLVGKPNISGIVVDRDTNQGIGQALITLAGRTEQCVTEDSGNFRIDLPSDSPKRLRLRVSKSGFQPLDTSVEPPADNLSSAPAKTMKKLISIVFVVTVVLSELCVTQAKNLTMSGFVTDKVSRPLAGAQVTVIGNKAKSDTTTDSDGAFIVTLAQGVQEGDTVRIQIEKSGYKPYEKLVAASSAVPQRISLESVRAKLRQTLSRVWCRQQWREDKVGS
jgi:Carboxypeptidase regulatory-like domain